ncbi:hypothetical protein [Mycolicibacterium sp.]|uniref:hypothetical protein n=1 Tax=Mycolicibacterium sp. TaxID=2320850 RepID=UPI003560E6B6
MLPAIEQTVTILADLTDPTPDGILSSVVNYALTALMVVVALCGGWFAFKAWADADGKGNAMKDMRSIVYSIIVVEAILGGVIILANYGTSIIPGFAG